MLAICDDFLEGLGGADVLRGGRGSDTYLWKPGDGDDTIIDPVSGDEANVLRFGEGVTAAGLSFRNDGRDLLITHKAMGETITVSNWYLVENHRFAKLEFSDKTYFYRRYLWK